jgi:hypothetical protein
VNVDRRRLETADLAAPVGTHSPLVSVAEAKERLLALQSSGWPRTKMARLRELRPEVEQALSNGHSYETLRAWLASIGLEYSRQTLYDAVSKLRRSQTREDVELSNGNGG